LKKRRIERSAAELQKGGQQQKKEKDKENELSEEEKAKQKSKPVSSTAVPGTPWCVVWTRDKRVFFYNPSEKVSLWERPPILIGRSDVDKMIKECPVSLQDGSAAANNTTSTAAATTAQKKKTPVEASPVVANSEPPVKKNKIEDPNDENSRGSQSPRSDGSASPGTPSKVAPDEFLQEKKIEASKEAAIEAENKAAQVRAQLPLEQRIQQFKDLLIEKDVSAYSTWERELQKIVFDPRYLLLTSKERKQVFEKYVRERADQESKERSAALKKKRDEFRELLKEAITTPKSAPSFGELAAKYSRDDRFKGIDKTKDRESLYNDYLSELRRQLEKQEESKHGDKKKNFYSMLKELKSLHRHSSWTETKRLVEGDSRYKAIESSVKREDYFRDYCKTLPEKESKSNGTSDKKDRDRDRDRDRERERDKDKEKSKSKSKHDDSDRREKESKLDDGNGKEEGETDDENDRMDTDQTDEEQARREREKQERVEQSLRERSKEVKEQLSKIKSETEKERDQLKRDEAIESFRALLIDLIKPTTVAEKDKEKEKEKEKDGDEDNKKQPEDGKNEKHHHKSNELSWKEAKKILKKDPRWSLSKMVEKEKKEQLFDEHIAKFRAKKRDMFHQLLIDTPGIVIKVTTWKEAKKLIKSDPRYEKLSNSELKLEKEFDSFMSERYQKARADFRELLAQTKLITYKTYTTLKEQANHMKEIEDLLCNDKAYTTLDSVSEERKKMLLDYIEQLHNEGPPPPPTATEPVRSRK